MGKDGSLRKDVAAGFGRMESEDCFLVVEAPLYRGETRGRFFVTGVTGDLKPGRGVRRVRGSVCRVHDDWLVASR